MSGFFKTHEDYEKALGRRQVQNRPERRVVVAAPKKFRMWEGRESWVHKSKAPVKPAASGPYSTADRVPVARTPATTSTDYGTSRPWAVDVRMEAQCERFNRLPGGSRHWREPYAPRGPKNLSRPRAITRRGLNRLELDPRPQPFDPDKNE